MVAMVTGTTVTAAGALRPAFGPLEGYDRWKDIGDDSFQPLNYQSRKLLFFSF